MPWRISANFCDAWHVRYSTGVLVILRPPHNRYPYHPNRLIPNGGGGGGIYIGKCASSHKGRVIRLPCISIGVLCWYDTVICSSPGRYFHQEKTLSRSCRTPSSLVREPFDACIYYHASTGSRRLLLLWTLLVLFPVLGLPEYYSSSSKSYYFWNTVSFMLN